MLCTLKIKELFLNIKKQIKELFDLHPTLYSMLKDSESPRAARTFILSYINETRRILNQDSHKKQPLEFILQMNSLLVFRRLTTTRSERLTKYSLVKLLRDLAHQNEDEWPEDLNEGFFEEMKHLFLGMAGKSGIYDEESYPEFVDLHGREASILRSNQLDKIGKRVQMGIAKYPSGLDEKIIDTRKKNKKRILKYFNADESDWNNYEWQLNNVIRDEKVLGSIIDLTDEDIESIQRAVKIRIPFGITPYYASLMDKSDSQKWDQAVRAQVIPNIHYVDKMQAHREDRAHSFDFMMESDTSPEDLITRRYPQIVILKPYNTCSQICVYCQRNWEIEEVLSPGAMASEKRLKKAYQWLENHPVINEVLVTGGDPLVMNDAQVESVLEHLSKMKHIERIRIGTRTPVVLPMRLTDALVDIIAKFHEPGKREIALVSHYEHPYEITPESLEAVQQFKKRGISVYNQAVFTLANSRRFELVALRRLLRLIGVDPYYTFNTKGKEETKRFRVPLARLQQEVQEEARLVPGLVRTDEPVYNVPKLGKNYIRAQQHHSLITILPDGRRVYEFHPWEKKLALADTYIDVDVSITEYLKELKKLGENVNDYKTIWYYF